MHIHHYRTIIILLILQGLVIFTSCGDKNSSKEDVVKPLTYPVIILEKKNVTVNYDYVASIQGQEDVEIRPLVDGNLKEIYIDEGQNVKKGQLLFKINDDLLSEQVLSAEADLKTEQAGLDNARMEVERVIPLVEKNIMSKYKLYAAESSLEAAKAKVEKAKSLLDNSKTKLNYSNVLSPSNGTAGKIYYKQGSLVGPQTKEPLTVISKNEQVYAYFSVTESDMIEFDEYYRGKNTRQELTVLPAVTLILPNGEMYKYSGKIDATTGLINSQTGTLSLRASFPNPEFLLRSGNSGTVRLPDEYANALIIPQKSTFEIQDKIFVYVVGSDSTVKGRQIFTNETSGNFFIIDKGLNEGEMVVYEGVSRLKENTKIIPERISLDSLINSDTGNIIKKEQ